MAEQYINMDNLAVGYNGKDLIHDICIGIEKGDNVSVSAIMAVVGVFMLVTSPFVSGFIASVGLPVLIDKLLKSKNEKE